MRNILRMLIPGTTPLLRVSSIARQCEVHPATVRRWIATGALAGIRVGGELRVEPEALRQFLKPAGPTEAA